MLGSVRAFHNTTNPRQNIEAHRALAQRGNRSDVHGAHRPLFQISELFTFETLTPCGYTALGANGELVDSMWCGCELRCVKFVFHISSLGNWVAQQFRPTCGWSDDDTETAATAMLENTLRFIRKTLRLFFQEIGRVDHRRWHRLLPSVGDICTFTCSQPSPLLIYDSLLYYPPLYPSFFFALQDCSGLLEWDASDEALCTNTTLGVGIVRAWIHPLRLHVIGHTHPTPNFFYIRTQGSGKIVGMELFVVVSEAFCHQRCILQSRHQDRVYSMLSHHYNCRT